MVSPNSSVVSSLPPLTPVEPLTSEIKSLQRKTHFFAIGLFACATVGAIGAAYCMTTIPPLAPVVLVIGLIAAKYLANQGESTFEILGSKRGLQAKEIEQQPIDRKAFISLGVSKASSILELEKYIETTDDLIHLLKERASRSIQLVLKTNDEDYLFQDTFLKPLLSANTAMGNRLETKFNIKLVEFAVRNIHEPILRMYLASAFHQSDVFFTATSLTEDEIISFLRDIEDFDLEKEHGSTSFCVRRHAEPLVNSVMTYIFPANTSGINYHPRDYSTVIARRIRIFNEYFAQKIDQDQFMEYFFRCIRNRDPQLLRVLIELGDQKLDLWSYEQIQNIPNQKLLELLTEAPYFSDYHELKDTIDLLIKEKFLNISEFEVSSTHELIMKKFLPSEYVAVHLLQSEHRDVETLKLFLNAKSFYRFMKDAAEALNNPDENEATLRGSDFLFEHYIELNNYLKNELSPVLNLQEFAGFKIQIHH